jgi:benzoyl-CoA reductase/2-hydroxyglutaryl-CoA dehydratase subunit BcrC/BadD/HgdB
MDENTNAIGSADFDLLRYLSDYTDAGYAHCMKKYPDREWMFKIQKAAWNPPYHATKEGKRLVFMGASVPPELCYAFDAVPLLTDAIATRLASDPDVINRYLDIGSEVVPPHVCGIDRTILGMVFSGDLRIKPDAYIYGTIPCDSARAAYPVVADKFKSDGVPTMAIDAPYRKDQYGIKYIADQMREMVTFLEGVYDEKIDRNKLAAVIYRSNEATRLLMAIAELRKLKPSYAMSRLLVLNELYMSMLGSQEIIDFLRSEYDYIVNNIENHITAVPEEKHRFTWIQDMVWSNVGTLDWMEKTYGAVCAMDVLGYNQNIIIDDPWDEEQIYTGLALRQLNVPMMHASSGPALPYIDLTEQIIKEYDIDVSMFVGHVGCKHTWACKKMVEDAIESRLGITTFTLDLDALDGRYKSTEEIRSQISEYMDSLT